MALRRIAITRKRTKKYFNDLPVGLASANSAILVLTNSALVDSRSYCLPSGGKKLSFQRMSSLANHEPPPLPTFCRQFQIICDWRRTDLSFQRPSPLDKGIRTDWRLPVVNIDYLRLKPGQCKACHGHCGAGTLKLPMLLSFVKMIGCGKSPQRSSNEKTHITSRSVASIGG